MFGDVVGAAFGGEDQKAVEARLIIDPANSEQPPFELRIWFEPRIGCDRGVARRLKIFAWLIELVCGMEHL